MIKIACMVLATMFGIILLLSLIYVFAYILVETMNKIIEKIEKWESKNDR